LRLGPAVFSVYGNVSPRDRADQDLAKVLRALRERDGRSQEALAHDAGLTVAAMARVERGQTNPTWTTVSRIASALGVSLSQLGRAVDKRRPG
jgi:transcriptional regulator with XRE-family HTH domain